jgi:molecular chaperone GrpE
MKDKVTKGAGKENGEDEAFSVIDRRPTFGNDSAAATEPRYPSVVEDLKARAEEAERRAREISTAYRRIDEEREAFRLRLSRDLERRVEIARVEMMRKILGVLDDLDRALAVEAGTSDAGALLSGVTLIRDHLLSVLSSEGVQVLDLVGQRFDPALAEAVSVEETDDPARDNLILSETGRGYTLGATLVRPARVRVARYRAAESQEGPRAPGEAPQGSASRRSEKTIG